MRVGFEKAMVALLFFLLYNVVSSSPVQARCIRYNIVW